MSKRELIKFTKDALMVGAIMVYVVVVICVSVRICDWLLGGL